MVLIGTILNYIIMDSDHLNVLIFAVISYDAIPDATKNKNDRNSFIQNVIIRILSTLLH